MNGTVYASSVAICVASTAVVMVSSNQVTWAFAIPYSGTERRKYRRKSNEKALEQEKR